MKPLNKIRLDDGHKIVYYTCGCKSCKAGKLKKLIFDVGYNQETQTERILKEIAAGDYGLEWKRLLEQYSTGSVDIRAELFVCSNCGAWINDYNLSFYILPAQYSAKIKSVFSLEGYSRIEYQNVIEGIEKLINKYQNHYQFYREYQHKCPDCLTTMKRVPLKKNLWIDENKIKELALKCPDCKLTIQIKRHNC